MHELGYGVIIGRFEVCDLTEGHLMLLKAVDSLHEGRLVILLGTAVVTKRNPLNYDTRVLMIKEKFPKAIILPIADGPYDDDWSSRVDATLKLQFPTPSGSWNPPAGVAGLGTPVHELRPTPLTLYGSRDSFIPFYDGIHPKRELDFPIPHISGTDSRRLTAATPRHTSDFRAGIIYALENQYTRVMPTVDIALLHQENQRHEVGYIKAYPSGISVLLGSKKTDRKLRFIGGFAETYGTYEENAVRELEEETGYKADPAGLTYLGSMVVPDWRYRNCPEQIKTSFFTTWTSEGRSIKTEDIRVQPNDDIASLEWVKFEDLTISILEPVHHGLLPLLQKFIWRK